MGEGVLLKADYSATSVQAFFVEKFLSRLEREGYGLE